MACTTSWPLPQKTIFSNFFVRLLSGGFCLPRVLLYRILSLSVILRIRQNHLTLVKQNHFGILHSLPKMEDVRKIEPLQLTKPGQNWLCDRRATRSITYPR